MILEMFHEDVDDYTVLIFSHADRLRGESIETFVSRQNQKIQDLVARRFMSFDNTNPMNREQVSQLLQKVDELPAMKENRHFTCQIHEVMEEATKIMERRMLDNLKNIKKEVRKMADVRRAVFMAEINEEKQEMERKRKQIQHRIDRIEADIKKEEKNVQTIPERLRRYKATLKREQENLRKLEERRMEEERERNTRKEKEDKDLNIWIREEEERRLSAAGQKKQHSSPFNKETALFILFLFLIFVLGFVHSLLKDFR
ncbi:hypothetical protein QQF64_015744 [Cirrhinus molitorella]|uniref:AIG1-type G domain-containing protein n=1 Tax=Cirrhinus molitorella TaxID=172907 RepID=A0ABR3NVS5_9TELE